MGDYVGNRKIKPSFRKLMKSDLLVFFSIFSLSSVTPLIAIGLVLPSLPSDTSGSDRVEMVQIVLISLGIAELAIALFIIAWRYRFVSDILMHGVEVKSKIMSYGAGTAVGEFEYVFQGERHRVQKRYFGLPWSIIPPKDDEAVLIVHQEKPDRFVIRDQYL
jgi:hypothetical protein